MTPWSAITCLFTAVDVVAEGPSGILRRFNDRLRGFGGEGNGVCAGQGLVSNGREDMIVMKKKEKKVGFLVYVLGAMLVDYDL
jgi:hypothetical protein